MSERKDDGGPAFPNVDYIRAGEREVGKSVGGMLLRDYFAAHAPADFISGVPDHITIDGATKRAYMWADSMLAARKEKP